MHAVDTSFSNMINIISKLDVDTTTYSGEVIVDEKVVNFYNERFQMFIEDGARECLSIYLNRLRKATNINPITKLVIMQNFFEITAEH